MAANDVISFGPFRLVPTGRVLLKDEKVLDVGSRALDVLVALVEAGGEVVGQKELIDRVWPNVIVGDGSLRVTIAGLRKALGDGQDGARYIATVTGRGYSFVAPIRTQMEQPTESKLAPLQMEPRSLSKHKLPTRLARMVGRRDLVETLSMLIVSRRFVSLVGAGGMGKTTVAVCIAHTLLDEFSDAVFFVDLGPLADASLVPSALATALGLSIQSQDTTGGLLAFLAGRRVLLVLDNCEHLIDAVAPLAERLYGEAAQVHILTTSREALRVEGEHVHLLGPLDYPPIEENVTAAEALRSSAVQLFMDRAFASGYASNLTDADAWIVVAICSRLDGIALAIELAGSRVATYGLQGTLDLLSNRFKLLWQGRRSAPARHQTLTAMVDWSFNLLSDCERQVLCRLSIFVGPFSLDAAQAVAADNQTNMMDVADAIADLVSKSLVIVAPVDGAIYYRLLDTTSAYAAGKLEQTCAADVIEQKHADYFARWLQERDPKDPTATNPHMGNIRAALEWSFSEGGDAAVGVQLATLSASLFFELSLLVECSRWCRRGLDVISESPDRQADRLILQATLAASAMFTRGNSEEVRRSLEDSLELAEALGDDDRQMHLLAGLSIFLTRTGDFRDAVVIGERSLPIGSRIGSSGAIAAAEWMLGVAAHLAGDQASALIHCERGIEEAKGASLEQLVYFGYDQRIRALVALARCLWLHGFSSRALKTARQAIKEAVEGDHPVNLCIAMIYSTNVFLWCGKLDEARTTIQGLIAHAARDSLAPYHNIGLALTGELSIACGDPDTGVSLLRRALKILSTEKHHTLTWAFQKALAEGLLKSGAIDEAADVITAALARSEVLDEQFGLPELLRLQGQIRLRFSPPNPMAAEAAFVESMRRAKSQSALGFELRAAFELASLWASQGKREPARDLIEDVLSRFAEGHETPDLKVAMQLLEHLDTGTRATDETNART